MTKVVVLILSAIFGLFFLAFGVAGVAMEYQVPPVHTSHLIGFLFMVLLGAVLMPGVGAVIFARLKDGVGLAGPFFPSFGRRAYDPVAIPPGPPPDPHAGPAPEMPHVPGDGP